MTKCLKICQIRSPTPNPIPRKRKIYPGFAQNRRAFQSQRIQKKNIEFRKVPLPDYVIIVPPTTRRHAFTLLVCFFFLTQKDFSLWTTTSSLVVKEIERSAAAAPSRVGKEIRDCTPKKKKKNKLRKSYWAAKCNFKCFAPGKALLFWVLRLCLLVSPFYPFPKHSPSRDPYFFIVVHSVGLYRVVE